MAHKIVRITTICVFASPVPKTERTTNTTCTRTFLNKNKSSLHTPTVANGDNYTRVPIYRC